MPPAQTHWSQRDLHSYTIRYPRDNPGEPFKLSTLPFESNGSDNATGFRFSNNSITISEIALFLTSSCAHDVTRHYLLQSFLVKMIYIQET